MSGMLILNTQWEGLAQHDVHNITLTDKRIISGILYQKKTKITPKNSPQIYQARDLPSYLSKPAKKVA